MKFVDDDDDETKKTEKVKIGKREVLIFNDLERRNYRRRALSLQWLELLVCYCYCILLRLVQREGNLIGRVTSRPLMNHFGVTVGLDPYRC